VEAKNIIIEYRWAEGRNDRLPDLAAELVRLKVDIIVVGGNSAIRAAKSATKTIPIVMQSSDPVETGLVASLARPGGNITGLSYLYSYGFERETTGASQGGFAEDLSRGTPIPYRWQPS
jgi:putative ABC transport system substrate-binding protein